MKEKLVQSGIFIAFLCVLYFIVDLFVLPIYTRHGDEFEMMDLTEKSIEEVRTITEKHDLELIVKDSTFSPLYKPGIVVSQQPNAFSLVKEGRRVYVTVSLGDKPVIVPDLTGSSLRNARFMLEAVNLVLGEVIEEYSMVYPKDVVFAQSYEKGTELIAGDTVQVTLSLGKDFTQIPIEDYTGLPFEKAKKQAQARGLTVQKEVGEVNVNIVPGTVVLQSLAVGDYAELNQTIIFTISQ